MWTTQVVRLYGYSIPILIAAVLLGEKVNLLIPQGKFDKIIYGFLVVIGVFLIIR
jgi:hypothetical protein